MNELLANVSRYGAGYLFFFCFLEASGIPIPAALALITGGAAAAKGLLHPGAAWMAGMGGLLAGDTLLFFIGRYTGWWLLGVLCRVTANPEACIFTSASAFHKRGRATLVLAKFVPGLAAMAAPLAGSMSMSTREFLMFDLAGAALYVTAYGVLGFLASDLLSQVFAAFQTAGQAVEAVAILAVFGYIGWRVWLSWKAREMRTVPRVDPGELEGAVWDVRSHGYYGSRARRIKGAKRLEPNSLPEAMSDLPAGQKIFLYCTCHNDATSVRVAHWLRQNGFESYVIRGGLKAWEKAGQPTEPVPADDIMHLPTFGR